MSTTAQSNADASSFWDDEVRVNGLLLGFAAATGAVSSFALGINPVEATCLIGIPAAAVFRVAAEGVRGVAYLTRRIGTLIGGAGRAVAAEAVADVKAGKWGRSADHAPTELRYSARLTDTGWQATAYQSPSSPTSFPTYARVSAIGDATITRYADGKLQATNGCPSIAKIASDGQVTGAWYHEQGVPDHAWRPENGPLDISVPLDVLTAELDSAIMQAGDGLLAGQLLELLDRAECLELDGVNSASVRITDGKLDVAALSNALSLGVEKRPAL
jgi:hypothetical protein